MNIEKLASRAEEQAGDPVPYLSLKRVTAMHLAEMENAMKRVVESGWFLKGEATRYFEECYASYIGTDFCVGCGNGLDALILIFRAYKELGLLKDGDEIIVPANTYIASILAITENGLKPVLVEPRLDSLELNDNLLEQAFTERTRAVLLVHLYGRCAMTDKVETFCRKHQVLLVEDNAQAHGCTWKGRRTGSLGNAAAHSFYPGKNLGALGDAGAITTNDKELADMCRALGNYGSSKKYVFEYRGLNSRMDELQAAALSVKLKYLDEENNRRKQIAAFYYKRVCSPHIVLPGSRDWTQGKVDHVFHIFPVLCSRRDDLRRFLLERGVNTMIHYPIPPHRQRCYAAWSGLQLPVTEQIHAQELSIPCNPTMTDQEVSWVADALNEAGRRM